MNFSNDLLVDQGTGELLRHHTDPANCVPHVSGNLATAAPKAPAAATLTTALTAALVLAGDICAPFFDPFFGNYAPAASDPLALPDGQGGTYVVSQLYSFGDRLADTGNPAALEKSLGEPTPLGSAPYSSTGSFSDGPNWTTELSQILGAQPGTAQTNFAYEDATARVLDNPLDPNQSKTGLANFEG